MPLKGHDPACILGAAQHVRKCGDGIRAGHTAV